MTKEALAEAGFSLLEILLVLCLLGIFAGTGLAMSLSSYKSSNFYSEQELILSLLSKARAESLANVNGKPHGLYIDQPAKTYIIFTGQDFSHRDPVLDNTFSMGDCCGFSGASEVVFEQLTGSSLVLVNISLNDGVHPQANISVNTEGRINLD